MNKYLTALFILVSSMTGVAHAACGPNGCSADTTQYSAPKTQRPTNYGYYPSSTNYQSGQSQGCNCSR